MELVPRRRLELFSGRSHPELAREIADLPRRRRLGEANLREFADGEIHCRYDELDPGRGRLHHPDAQPRR